MSKKTCESDKNLTDSVTRQNGFPKNVNIGEEPKKYETQNLMGVKTHKECYKTLGEILNSVMFSVVNSLYYILVYIIFVFLPLGGI